MNPSITPINGTCENSCEYTQPAEVPFGCPQVDCPEPVRLVIPEHDVEVQSDCDTTETKQAGLTVEAVIPASNIVNVRVIDCGNQLDPEIICVAPIASPTDAPMSAVIVFGKDYPADINDYKIYLGNVDVTATHIQVPCDATEAVTTETAGGVLVASGATFNLPSNVKSFTVTAQSGSFDVSFDNGVTYALTGRVGSRSWGEGTIEVIGTSSNVVIRSGGDVDVIYEI